jgi:hypothetical protein
MSSEDDDEFLLEGGADLNMKFRVIASARIHETTVIGNEEIQVVPLGQREDDPSPLEEAPLPRRLANIVAGESLDPREWEQVAREAYQNVRQGFDRGDNCQLNAADEDDPQFRWEIKYTRLLPPKHDPNDQTLPHIKLKIARHLINAVWNKLRDHASTNPYFTATMRQMLNDDWFMPPPADLENELVACLESVLSCRPGSGYAAPRPQPPPSDDEYDDWGGAGSAGGDEEEERPEEREEEEEEREEERPEEEEGRDEEADDFDDHLRGEVASLDVGTRRLRGEEGRQGELEVAVIATPTTASFPVSFGTACTRSEEEEALSWWESRWRYPRGRTKMALLKFSDATKGVVGYAIVAPFEEDVASTGYLFGSDDLEDASSEEVRSMVRHATGDSLPQAGKEPVRQLRVRGAAELLERQYRVAARGRSADIIMHALDIERAAAIRKLRHVDPTAYVNFKQPSRPQLRLAASRQEVQALNTALDNQTVFEVVFLCGKRRQDAKVAAMLSIIQRIYKNLGATYLVAELTPTTEEPLQRLGFKDVVVVSNKMRFKDGGWEVSDSVFQQADRDHYGMHRL